MNRDQAIDIARRRALNSRDTHAYLPVTEADAQTWMPHEWVIDALMSAHNLGKAEQSRVTEKAFEAVNRNAMSGDPQGWMDDSDRLKPCPFCGSEAEFGVLGDGVPEMNGGHFVQCTNSACGCSSALVFPLMDDVKSLLLERWNRRQGEIALRIKTEEHDCCAEDLLKLRQQATDAASDAARYRWLRDHADDENEGDTLASRIMFETAPEGWDAAIDAALAESIPVATCSNCGYRVCHEDCGAEDYEFPTRAAPTKENDHG